MKVVIIGASRGIGAGLAQAYRTRGCHVVGTGRSIASDAQLDVTLPASHTAFAEALGPDPVDLLVCNAGVFLDKGEALDTGYGADLWAKTFATNVTGVFLSIQALLPQLRAAKSAKIAIISSQMASQTHAPGNSLVYRSSKAAVLNLGRNLSSELRKDGIAVGIYHPGWVQTDMGGSAADITVDQSVSGLLARFDVLSLDTTGCFETWDGRAHPY